MQQAQLDDYGNQIAANIPWLVEKAGSVDMATDGIISQGFGVISSVLLASCGLNLGLRDGIVVVRISGTLQATNAMAGNASETDAGSYAETQAVGRFRTALWPANAGPPATTYVPIAFQFASF